MSNRNLVRKVSSLLAACMLSMSVMMPASVDARTHSHSSHSQSASSHSSARHASSRTSGHSSSRSGGRKRTEVAVSSRHHHKAAAEVAHGHHHHAVVAHTPRTRYAYPVSIFMLKPPEFERDALPPETADRIARAFQEGHADDVAARSLVRAGLVAYHPLHGGIFWRREPVKYIIIHSTETGIPLGAQRVIDSWGSAGRRHAGAQYVIDRDGMIIQAVDPDLATVHVNIFKTLPGINNDNSIGIEMCHTGHQNYPAEQRQSLVKLVAYLQDRYNVSDQNVITHRYAQQGDHTDPVNFDWEGFLAEKDHFRTRAIAYKMNKVRDDSTSWRPVNPPAQAGGPMIIEMAPAGTTRVTTTTRVTSVRTAPESRSAALQGGETGAASLLRGPIEMDPAVLEQIKAQQLKELNNTTDVKPRLLPANIPQTITAPPPAAPDSVSPASAPTSVPIAPRPVGTPQTQPSANPVNPAVPDVQVFVH